MCKSRFLKDVLSEMTTFGPGEGAREGSKRCPRALETTFERASKGEGEKRKQNFLWNVRKKKVGALEPPPNPFLVPKMSSMPLPPHLYASAAYPAPPPYKLKLSAFSNPRRRMIFPSVPLKGLSAKAAARFIPYGVRAAAATVIQFPSQVRGVCICMCVCMYACMYV